MVLVDGFFLDLMVNPLILKLLWQVIAFGPWKGFDNSTYTLGFLNWDLMALEKVNCSCLRQKNQLVIFVYPFLLNGFVSTVPGNPLEQ